MGACTSQANHTDIQTSKIPYDRISITQKSTSAHQPNEHAQSAHQPQIDISTPAIDDEESQESMNIHNESGRPSITITSAHSQASTMFSLNSPMNTKRNGSKSLNYHMYPPTETESDTCNLNGCATLKQILKTLRYQIDENKNNESARGHLSQYNIETQSSLVTQLNNFYHILQEHSNHFEALYNHCTNDLFPNSRMYDFCDIETCPSVHRLYMHSSVKIDENSANIKDVIITEIIDIIHCYLLHSYDIGYAVNNTQCNSMQYPFNVCGGTEQKINDFEIENYMKHTKYKNILDFQETKRKVTLTNGATQSNNRFVTKLETNYSSNASEICPKFYYWQCYKDSEQWFVHGKYGNLKEEILAHNISKNEWNLLYEKSNIYASTEYMLSLKANGACLQNYEMEIITLNHIISVLLYCNYFDFCNGLRQSFVRQSIDESNEEFIQRHSVYVNVSRCLKETIDCFGEGLNNSNKNSNFYHGANFNVLMTQSIIGEIEWNAPISTTQCFEVMALHLNGFNENIDDTNALVLNGTRFDNSKYFNCAFCSKYPNESERIVMGTKERLFVNTMIDGLEGYDYRLYVMGLNIICYILRGEKYTHFNPNLCVLKYVLNRLFSVDLNKDIPKVVIKLLEKYREEMQCVNIDLNIMHKMEIKCGEMENNNVFYGYKLLKDIFVKECDHFIDLKKFGELFPNLTEITMFGSDQIRKERVALLPDLIKTLLSDLKEMNTLRTLSIINPNESRMAISNTLGTYKGKFTKIGWNVSFRRKTEKNVCRYILKFAKIEHESH